MKIDKIEGYVLSSPYGDGSVFGQPKGVKSIAIVEVHVDGLVGYGESYAGVYAPELFVHTVNFLSERVVGKKLSNELIEQLNVPFVGGSGFMRSVIGAFDIAFMDIKSQSLSVPLYKLLSSDYEPAVITYASGGSVVYTVDQIKEEVERVKRCKFDYYKLRCGHQGLTNDRKRIEVALEIMDDETVMVDFIQGTLKNMSTEEIMYNIEVLNDYSLFWIEEIVRPHDIDLLQRVKEFSSNPIAMGEHLTNELEFRNMSPWVDYIQPDVTQCGGYYYLSQILKYFSHTPIAMHCWGSAISFMANLHMAISKNAIMEQPLVTLRINDHLYKEDIYQYDGLTYAPKEPGLGIHISKEVKDEYKFVKGSGYKI